MPAKTRNLLTLLLGGALCWLVFAETWLWRGALIRVPLMLADQDGFPLPLLYWAGVAIYAIVCGRWFHWPLIRQSR